MLLTLNDYLTFLYMNQKIVNAWAGIPIKNIIHKFVGLVGSRYNNERYIDNIEVHNKIEIIIVLVSFLCQTAVRTKRIIHVIGRA